MVDHLWENMYELEPSGTTGEGTLIWLHGLAEKVTSLHTKFQMITPKVSDSHCKIYRVVLIEEYRSFFYHY